jgi:hypothetical protein
LFWFNFDQKIKIIHKINNNARSSSDDESTDESDIEATKKIIHNISREIKGKNSDDDDSTDESEMEANLNLIRDTCNEINGKKSLNQPIVLLIVLLLHPVHQICLNLQ